MEIRVIDSLLEVPPQGWNALSDGANPFVRHEFLAGLERHDCLEPQGWFPQHLAAYEGEQLLGALPLYLRSNSFGEFVFDWSWADAYEQAGGRYYPKLVSAIPFTPATGPRLLVSERTADAAVVRDALVQAALELARELGVSSLHCLFPQENDARSFQRRGLMRRTGCQYHWFNRGYPDFDAFLGVLTSKRRKQIRRERREVAESGVTIEVLNGGEIDRERWRIFYEFYCSTFHRKWGEPRLTLEFFESLSSTMPRETLLLLASHRGRYVAGAFAMCGTDTLFGRHWGCSARFRNLHFEMCYYRTIGLCIERGLGSLDAGAQGEHKVARGFEPTPTWSVHWLQDPGFSRAVSGFLRREAAMVEAYMRDLQPHLPYRQNP